MSFVHVYTMLSFFFFSSRRRHTRFDCDWSSDVCSSDLLDHERPMLQRRAQLVDMRGNESFRGGHARRLEDAQLRSEERRVGEEGRSRGAADHLKKKKKID